MRQSFEQRLASYAKTNPKVFWKYAKSRQKTRQTIPTSIRKDGSKSSTAQEKADTLNEFFASVFTEEGTSNIPAPKNCRINDSLTSIEFTPNLVRTKLINLNPYKSPGHDNWHPYFLRELTDVISVPLSILFNKSLKEGAHRSWREAIIEAIYKKGDRSNPGNYRPVSLTSVIAKIMES